MMPFLPMQEPLITRGGTSLREGAAVTPLPKYSLMEGLSSTHKLPHA